jgi:murein tripeptide amidase MpaA
MRVVVPEDSGNAVPLELGPGRVRVGLRPDNAAAFAQWFWFRLEDLDPGPLEVRIDTAGASYPKGFERYRAVGSSGGDDWVRLPTRLDGTDLVLEWVPERPHAEVAYFAPYPTARRAARLAATPHEVLATSPDGLPLAKLTLGRGPRQVWVIGRQHPGETMGEWFVEGLVDALRSNRVENGLGAHGLLDRATLHVVPCVNVDGARRGNHRTNARGQDLNRAWNDPDPALAPEVHAILAAMDRTGVDVALDIHGDEEIPHNFASGAEGTPSWDAAKAARQAAFVDAWCAATPDFQKVHGYPISAPGQADLRICTNALAERFGCLSLTIEQPFADHDDHPDPRTGWSPARCRALGASMLGPLASSLGG